MFHVRPITQLDGSYRLVGVYGDVYRVVLWTSGQSVVAVAEDGEIETWV